MEQVAAAWDYFWRVSVNISDGLGVTLGLFALTLLFSIPLGLIISLGAISRFKPLSWLVKFYIWLLRGTPLLLQLLFVYFGLPLVFQLLFDYFNLPLQFNIDNFTAAVIAFVLNYAAYFAEIFRAGIQSIDKGQFEAAKALGLSSGQTMWRVVIPQAISRILPRWGTSRLRWSRTLRLCRSSRCRTSCTRRARSSCARRALRRSSLRRCSIWL